MNHAAGRAVLRQPRSVRVPTPGVRARVNSAPGDLLNVSATGALVRVDRELPVGTDGPLLVDTQGRRIDLFGRVVRCVRLAIELPGGAVLRQPSYAIGVMFTYASASAIEGIAQLCGGAIAIEELPSRVLLVSDDAGINRSVSSTMSQKGYHVRLVTDAREALAAAKESHADLIIVNLKSNRERSMWWVLDLLASDGAVNTIPVVALAEPSAITAEHHRVISERGVALLSPSFSTQELLTLIAVVLRGRQLPTDS
jgi:CheY-like chemotaxis protein